MIAPSFGESFGDDDDEGAEDDDDDDENGGEYDGVELDGLYEPFPLSSEPLRPPPIVDCIRTKGGIGARVPADTIGVFCGWFEFPPGLTGPDPLGGA